MIILMPMKWKQRVVGLREDLGRGEQQKREWGVGWGRFEKDKSGVGEFT